jgi:hypothetical protein
MESQEAQELPFFTELDWDTNAEYFPDSGVLELGDNI